MIEPYYSADGIEIFLGDCSDIAPTLGQFDLLCTDPPYGIGETWKGGWGDGWNVIRTWDGPRHLPGREHPTQKPLALMSWCLSLFKRPTSVLDPFMGSGTTLRACKDLGIRCVGIERERKYVDIAVQRLAQRTLDLGGVV